jgi:hypothetical protein
MKRFLKILAIFIVSGLAVLFFLGYRQFSIPQTAELHEIFADKRNAYETHAANTREAMSKREPIDSAANAQIGYLWLEVEPEPATYNDGDPIVLRYYTHARGIGVGAFGTGIAYLDPGLRVQNYPDIETMREDARKVEGFIGYSRISGNWYAFYWKAD